MQHGVRQKVNETDNNNDINYDVKTAYHLLSHKYKMHFFSHCVSFVPVLSFYLISYEYFIASPA
jgi:hypothetical protein